MAGVTGEEIEPRGWREWPGAALRTAQMVRHAALAAVEHDALTVAQATAYSAMVALFPALIVAAAFISFVPDTTTLRAQMAQFFNQVLPPNVSPLLEIYFSPVNRSAHLGTDGRPVVDRVADDVEDPAQALGSDWHRDGGSRVAHDHASDETVGRIHRDRAHSVLAEVLSHFERQVVLDVGDSGVGEFERAEDFRELAIGEFDVDDGADDLKHFAAPRRRAIRAERRLGRGGNLGLGHGMSRSRVGRRLLELRRLRQ